MEDFAFIDNNKIPRSQFRSRIYERVVSAFDNKGQTIIDVGAVDPTNAVGQMNRFQNGDVLVYIANDYDNDIGRVCDSLKAQGVVVLPVYLGKQVRQLQICTL